MDNEDLLEEEELVSSIVSFDDNIIPDANIISIDDCLKKILEIIDNLDYIDNYKDMVSNKRREIDYRILDILHPLEDVEKISDKGCKNIVGELINLRKMRRTLKVTDEMIYEFQKRYNRLSNHGNRDLVKSEICKTKSKLTLPYRNRIATQEDIEKLFDINQPQDDKPKKIGRPKKSKNNILEMEGVNNG